MKTKIERKAGFTLVEIMIVVAIIGLLAAIAIPNFVKARRTSQMNSCINALRLIDAAKQQIILEQPTAAVTGGIGGTLEPYIGRGANGTWPKCPVTGTDTYTAGAADVLPICANNTVAYPHVLQP